jgi:hypothetical protein
MKLSLALALVFLTACAAQSTNEAPAPARGPAKENRIALYLGQRNLNHDDWSPVDEQGTAGLEFVHETAASPVGFEVGIMGSSDDGQVAGIDVTGSTAELYGGVRKTFGEGVVRPYVGAGLSYIDATVEADGFADEDDSSLAGYVHGGVDFDITESLFLGLDLRVLFASDIEIAGVSGDADYAQLALRLGFAF